MNKIFNWIKKHKWEIFDCLTYWLIAGLIWKLNTWQFMAVIILVIVYGQIQVKKEKVNNERN